MSHKPPHQGALVALNTGLSPENTSRGDFFRRFWWLVVAVQSDGNNAPGCASGVTHGHTKRKRGPSLLPFTQLGGAVSHHCESRKSNLMVQGLFPRRGGTSGCTTRHGCATCLSATPGPALCAQTARSPPSSSARHCRCAATILSQTRVWIRRKHAGARSEPQLPEIASLQV